MTTAVIFPKRYSKSQQRCGLKGIKSPNYSFFVSEVGPNHECAKEQLDDLERSSQHHIRHKWCRPSDQSPSWSKSPLAWYRENWFNFILSGSKSPVYLGFQPGTDPCNLSPGKSPLEDKQQVGCIDSVRSSIEYRLSVSKLFRKRDSMVLWVVQVNASVQRLLLVADSRGSTLKFWGLSQDLSC